MKSLWGPALTIESDTELPVATDSVRLTLTQLVSDVPAKSGEMGPGAVRVCVTSGTLENAVEPSATDNPVGIGFRSRSALRASFKADESQRIRVFAASKFDGVEGAAGAQDCATTSLSALAVLQVPRGGFKAGRTYNLMLVGAVAPSGLCAPVNQSYIAQPGCPLPADMLTPQLLLR
jgi:hypothetical protein